MILGVVLAGGRSSRFGSDKALAELNGRNLLEHAIAALEQQCDKVVVAGRSEAPVTTIADWPAPDSGPLGGIAAALRWALEKGYDTVLSCGVDSVGLPGDLAQLLSPAPRYLEQQPVVGLWPARASGAIEQLLLSDDKHSMRNFAAMIGASPVKTELKTANVNTQADLSALESHYGI